MGLLDGIMGGSASEIGVAQAQTEFSALLGAGERVEKAYRMARDHVLFTNRRLIFVDRPGASGAKLDYHSVPYPSITHFSVEAGSSFDPDAELRIWIAGSAEPIEKQFTRQVNVYELQAHLAACLAR